LAGGIGLGVKEGSASLLIVAMLVSLCLWWPEALWKSFQYCYTDRIKLTEEWFRTGDEGLKIMPFQHFHFLGRSLGKAL